MSDDDARCAELALDVSDRLGISVTVGPWREGFDYYADVAIAPGLWTRVLLSPRVEQLDTSYEGVVDFGQVIHRQVRAYEAARAERIPVPATHLALFRDDTKCGRSLLLLDRLGDDSSWGPASEHALGEYVLALHGLPGHVLDPDQASVPWEPYVVDRIGQRLAAAAQHLGLEYRPDVAEIVRQQLNGAERPVDRLLHLDIRRSNLCVVAGEVQGLIDFANAICGDPWFELARIRFNGLLTDAFLVGYGIEEPTSWRADHATILAAYELDVAAMLVTVAAEEADDDDLFATASGRVAELLTILSR